MAFVLDASISVRWFIPSQQTTYSQMILSQMPGAIVHVPSIWPIEMTSVLVKELNKSTITPAQVDEFLALIGTFDIRVAPAINGLPALLHFAREHRLAPADATYIELALQLGMPLATADDKMREAALHAGVVLVA